MLSLRCMRAAGFEMGSDSAAITRADALKLLVILSAAFMVVLDFFIVIVALPAIGAALNASQASLQLIVAGYAIANAAGLVAGGRLGDLFGRRRMFLVGLGLFALASLGCGLASSATALVLMRFAQGLAGAVLQPQVLALLGLHFPAKRLKAFSYYAIAMGVAGVTGQLLGGVLVDMDIAGMGWRSCFLINVPVALAAGFAATRTLDERGALSSGTIDYVGMSLAAVSLICLVAPLSYGREHLQVLANTALLTAGVVAATTLWRHQRRLEARGGSPMLSPSLLAIPGFGLGLATVLIFYLGIASFYLILGLHLQSTLKMPATQSGQVFGLMGASFVLASLMGPRLGKRLGPRALLVGASILGLGHLVQAIANATQAHFGILLAGLVIEGAGIGMVMAPLVSRVLSRVPAAQAGLAAGVLSTMQSAGNALGVAFVSSVYFWRQAAVGIDMAGSPGFTLSLFALAALAMLVVWMLSRLEST